jgi:2-polyprenyl-3-methyl-5-hydroxy-6-metoxy-1,4-benzoquinol methylase
MTSEVSSSRTLRDEKTVAYFDEQVHDYSVDRLTFIACELARLASCSASLLDLGCGTGNTLAFLRESTGIRDLYAIDVSTKCLEATQARVGCPTYEGSILDDDLPGRIGRQFDFVIVAGVLHHLIGRTRRESKRYAKSAVHHALDMVSHGGYLVVMEPIFYPPMAMDAVFYIKKLMTIVTSRRIEIMGKWNNIGAPVVSYLTNEELIAMVEAGGRTEIIARDIDPDDQGRLGYIMSKTNTSLIARKVA